MMDLVTRECLCGCGKSFRVLPSNTFSVFYSRSHAELAAMRSDELAKLARKYLRDCIASEGGQRRMKHLKARRYRDA